MPEAERQQDIDELLKDTGADHRYDFDSEGEILIVIQPRETPVEKAAEKLSEAGYEKMDAGFDEDFKRHYDWFAFRIPNDPDKV